MTRRGTGRGAMYGRARYGGASRRNWPTGPGTPTTGTWRSAWSCFRAGCRRGGG